MRELFLIDKTKQIIYANVKILGEYYQLFPFDVRLVVFPTAKRSCAKFHFFTQFLNG